MISTKYSEDTKSKYKNGVFGSFFRNDPQGRQLFGSTFFDAVFKMKKGETSGVLQSNLGLHIVQVTDRINAQLLDLNDKIPPQNTVTVERESETPSSASARTTCSAQP